MVQHFLNASHNLVASELLFRTRGNQVPGIRRTFLDSVLFYIFVFDEIIIEDFFLYHLLRIQSSHHFLKALLLIQRQGDDRIRLKRFKNERNQFVNGLGRLSGKPLTCCIEELADASHHVGFIAVTCRQMNGFIVDGHHLLALFHHLRVTPFLFCQCLYCSQIVLCHLLPSVAAGCLSFGNRLQLHVAQIDAIQEEHHVGTNTI